MTTSAAGPWRHQAAAVLICQLLLALPFFGQPLHMDDAIYMDIGRNVLRSPWQPHAFPYCFEGWCAPDMASHSHPPFAGYWVGLILALTGEASPAQWKLHLGFLVFPLLFALSMLSLARRFSPSPVWATLLAGASPVAVVMSHNLMSDFPNLAFWTTGVALYVYGLDRGRDGLVWLAALPLFLAAFSSYPSLLACAVCWGYALLTRSRRRAAWLAPALPILGMALWLLHSSLFYGRFVLSATASYFVRTKETWALAGLVDKSLALVLFLAGTVAVPWMLVARSCRWMRGRGALLWLMVVLGISQIWVSGYALPEKALFVVLLFTGGLALAALPAASRALEGATDRLFLWGWVGAWTLVVLFVYSAASARYLLPLLPPFILLALAGERPAGSWGKRASLLLAVLLALLLSAADREMARAHRAIAAEAGERFRGWESRVRFGAEWGLRHYFQEQGFHQFLSTSDNLRGGEFVLSPEQAIPYTLPADAASMIVPLSRHTWNRDFPIRLMHRGVHTGFYSSGWGLLPFAFSRAPIELLKVEQISPLVEGMPEIVWETPDGARAIPVPVPGGGVDVQVPVPARMRLPYSEPLPAEVRFVWLVRGSGVLPRLGARWLGAGPPLELAVEPTGPLSRGDTAAEQPYRIGLPDVGPGSLVLEWGEWGQPQAATVFRNFVIVPPGY